MAPAWGGGVAHVLFEKIARIIATNNERLSIPINHLNKTRIAPTPSGFLHLGNVLSFAITAYLAREKGCKIHLRIDDLDQDRIKKWYIQDIFDTLDFLEIPWDEGPRNAKEFENSYSQLHRINMYHSAIEQLVNNKLVFACTCSRRQLISVDLSNIPCSCFNRQIPLDTKNASWRLLTGDNSKWAVKSYDGRVIQANLPIEMHNFVVKKKDGFPAYQLASIIDDLFYDVDFIVRGQDLWPSTIAQHALASALKEDDFKNITFYHHPLITDTSGKKLSKSAGATSIKYLRDNGKNAAEVYQLIASIIGINETTDNWQLLANSIINA